MEGIPVLRDKSTPVLVLLLAVLALSVASPAAASKFFTIDGDEDVIPDGYPDDAIPFSFTGSYGDVNGEIRPVNLGSHIDKIATQRKNGRP